MPPMSKRSPQTFAKRQRELARQEKQERKRAKRLERKQQKTQPEGGAVGEEFEVGVAEEVEVVSPEEQPSSVE